MQLPSPLLYFAAEYDCDAYGAGTFANSDCSTVPGAPNTGFFQATTSPYFVVGILLIVVAIALLFVSLRSKRHAKKR